MSTINTIRIAIADIMCQKTRFFLSILLIGISLVALGYFSMFTNVLNYNKDECNRLLTRGIDDTGAMQVFGDDPEQELLIKGAMDSGLFECVGTWESDVQGIPLPEEFMRCRVENGGDPAEATRWICIDRTALGIHNLKFAEKIEIPEEKWSDPQWHGIYLGGNYSGIPVGTVYEIEKVGGPVAFEVIGILEKGHQFVSDGVMVWGRADSIDSLEILDDSIIAPQGEGTPIWYWRSCNGAYTPAEGVSLDEARAYLEEKAEELGLKLETGYLKNGFYVGEIEERDIQRVDRELNTVLFVTCLLICSCILFMQMIGDKKQLGIYFANGFTNVDIIRIYMWQGILKVLIALLASYFVLKKYFDVLFRGMFEYGIGPAAISESRELSFHKIVSRWINNAALPGMGCAAAIVLAVCVAIPVLLLWRKVPAELLKDTRG